MERISNEEMEEMIDALRNDTIDDAEDLLGWFAENGVALLEELLMWRESDMMHRG